MTIMQLKYFLALCKFRKLRTTAEYLHVSEPAISVAIKRLEEAIGTPLFLRDKKQMLLTETGEYMRMRATEVVSEFDSLEAEMFQRQLRYPKVLQLGIPSSLSDYVFPPFFSDFLEINPAVLFEFVPGASKELARKVEGEQLELAICDRQEAATPSLGFVPLLTSQMLGCVCPEHPLAGAEHVTAKELREEKLIFLNESATVTQELRRWFRAQGEEPEIFMYSNRSGVTVSMVKRYNAVSFFLGEVVSANPHIREGRIKSFTLEPDVTLTHGLVYKKGRKLSREAKRMFQFCLDRQIEPPALR